MTGNITQSSKGKIGENNVIEYLDDDVYELPDSDFAKATTRLFDKIDHGEYGVLP